MKNGKHPIRCLPFFISISCFYLMDYVSLHLIRSFLVAERQHIEFQRNISSAKHISSFALAKHIENPIGIYILHLIRHLSLTPVSLRLSHGSALTIHRIVIHYLADASLPQGEGYTSVLFKYCRACRPRHAER